MSLNKIHRDSNKVKYNLILIRFTKIKRFLISVEDKKNLQEKNEPRKE